MPNPHPDTRDQRIEELERERDEHILRAACIAASNGQLRYDIERAESALAEERRKTAELAAKVCERYIDELYGGAVRAGMDVAANALQNCAAAIRALPADKPEPSNG